MNCLDYFHTGIIKRIPFKQRIVEFPGMPAASYDLFTQCWRKNEAQLVTRPSCAIFMNYILNQLILSSPKITSATVFPILRLSFKTRHYRFK